MESGGLRRKDTTKGPPLRILSLDGGGVRGYSVLILLQELMYKTYNETEGRPPKADQMPKPCEYFDLIAGTGTGGLIAIMLGRLRMDLETCKEVYIRMTRRVFETDKTIAGIPYKTTLFKASKLEEAIKDCVREHTIFEHEGNDGTARGGVELPMSPASSNFGDVNKRRSYASSMSGAHAPMSPAHGYGFVRWGNANASLYDTRENRTKTAVTAVYKGTPINGGSILLRSYDSRKEPAPETSCTIWQAGRATCATGLAFKPIQVGQSVFHDEGAGNYNPAPQIMDEAAVNEWPGRDVGVFISIGTGKRPSGTSHRQAEWWEGFVGSSAGSFADARRRLIAKIEDCEKTHRYMRDEHLSKRGVNPENYYRLNVEVGVGEFGMNEWSRLAEISTSTRMYLSQPHVRRMNDDAAAKMGRIERAKRRQLHSAVRGGGPESEGEVPPPLDPMAVELAGDDGPLLLQGARLGSSHAQPPARYAQLSSADDKFAVLPGNEPRYRLSAEMGGRSDYSDSSIVPSPRRSYELAARTEAPPLPPKAPLTLTTKPGIASSDFYGAMSPRTSGAGVRLPYPTDDGPPPVVNMDRKPMFVQR